MDIKIESVELLSNTFLVCKFSVSKELKKFFKEYEFFAEYNHDISDVPKSILTIPILSNLLPIAWFTGATIYTDSADRDFLASLNDLKNSFQEMHPKIKMGGGIVAKNIVENKKEKHTESPATLFSGGIDSLDTFVRYKDRRPYLVTVWGADINLDWETGWERVRVNNSGFAKKYMLENIFIKSNFRRFLHEKNLIRHCAQRSICSWWGEVQHGFALTGLCAPVSFSLGFGEIYVPSTHTEKFSVAWGSDPKIDNRIKWAGTKVIHDAYDLDRQDKIINISKHLKTKSPDMPIRVCWESCAGGNCSVCEKCCRTMTGFMAESIDPKNIGFSEIDIESVKKNFKIGRWSVDDNLLYMWGSIKNRLEKTGIPENSPYREYLQWLLDCDFNKYKTASRIRGWLRIIKHDLLFVFKH